ncbi:unnamed protein product [Lathyrus sativus]|nr:unnamed protein product [Lathyrus sativus]
MLLMLLYGIWFRLSLLLPLPIPCKGRSNEYGVGVWDQVTGKQVDFFYEPLRWSFGDADKLQWLEGSNCLLVATMFPRKDNCYISLLDFRAKKMVWCWSEWVLTSRLRRSYGGSICDFSIGGDRLFALHSEENVFDIWETPTPPIL